MRRGFRSRFSRCVSMCVVRVDREWSDTACVAVATCGFRCVSVCVVCDDREWSNIARVGVATCDFSGVRLCTSRSTESGQTNHASLSPFVVFPMRSASCVLTTRVVRHSMRRGHHLQLSGVSMRSLHHYKHSVASCVLRHRRSQRHPPAFRHRSTHRSHRVSNGLHRQSHRR